VEHNVQAVYCYNWKGSWPPLHLRPAAVIILQHQQHIPCIYSDIDFSPPISARFQTSFSIISIWVPPICQFASRKRRPTCGPHLILLHLGTQVILVLAPWQNPVPLSRAWCLWEILCALDSPGVEFLIRLPPADKQSFQEGITNNFRLAMDALVATQVRHFRCGWGPPMFRLRLFNAPTHSYHTALRSLRGHDKDTRSDWLWGNAEVTTQVPPPQTHTHITTHTNISP